jgi:hypothetical protein
MLEYDFACRAMLAFLKINLTFNFPVFLFFSFLGNAQVLVDLGARTMAVQSGGEAAITVPFPWALDVVGASAEAAVVDAVSGTLRIISRVGGDCVLVERVWAAHRVEASVIMLLVRVANLGSAQLTVPLRFLAPEADGPLHALAGWSKREIKRK